MDQGLCHVSFQARLITNCQLVPIDRPDNIYQREGMSYHVPTLRNLLHFEMQYQASQSLISSKLSAKSSILKTLLNFLSHLMKRLWLPHQSHKCIERY